ncbi:damage-inducible protein DinB [Pedobacter sp. KBS0701]|uniref:DinB family protein n=1 Tax=Pedobacter sp. KBS0701 TaxID=2578106 RepID=UPI00110D8224|nr:DinB family protein [Pedobacter sp. KBS0701]QDW27848.1 damage-inducible protein DinB [Pedobacter sp. KBS0701]
MLKEQYDFILSSRNTLLDYIRGISEQDFLTNNSSFGRGSIRNLLVHICQTYCAWIGERALGNEQEFLPFENYQTLQDCQTYFSQANEYIGLFIEKFKGNELQEMELHRNEEILKVNPLQLFTHVVTHEFHHKGQIMSLSRHLGYVPVDADIIR